MRTGINELGSRSLYERLQVGMKAEVLRRNPHALTASLASGEKLGDAEAKWVQNTLLQLRELAPGTPVLDGGLSLLDLKQIYTTARIIQGGIVAGRLALPATIGLGEQIRSTPMESVLADLQESEIFETEAFLNGMAKGHPRHGNDFPSIVKKYIAALATLLGRPYSQAFVALKRDFPELVTLGQDADELQRLSWSHMRWEIECFITDEELVSYRHDLRNGTEKLLALLKERSGVSFPPRVLQRDDWLDALKRPRQDPKVALFNSMRFFVTNAEVALGYSIGTLLVRLKLGSSPSRALEDHLKFGAQDIAAGARTFTHKARFQSRVGARPNDYRSFEQFLVNVGERAQGACLDDGGQIIWNAADALRERGYCPAQNAYESSDPDARADLAEEGRKEFERWKHYGRTVHGVEPVEGRPAPSELLGNAVVFMTMQEESPLRPSSSFMSELADRL